MKYSKPIFEQEEEEDNGILSRLYEYVAGEMTGQDLEDSDSFIHEVLRRNPRANSIIIFDIESEKFMKDDLDFDENDIWVYDLVMSRYGYTEFTDYSNISNDFSDGYYPYDRFNTENIEKLKKISSYLLPGKDFDINDREFQKQLNWKLEDILPGLVEGFVGSLWEQDEQVYFESIRDEIKRQLNIMENKMGFSFYNERVCSTVGDLIMMCSLFDYNGDLEGLYKKIISKFSRGVKGGWGEYYNFYDLDHFDYQGFNRDIEYRIDNAIELLEESGIDYKEFSNFVSRIKKYAPSHEWTRLPKNKTYSFRIDSFDPENMKVKVSISGNMGISSRMLDEEGFYNLLYHPELFDLQN